MLTDTLSSTWQPVTPSSLRGERSQVVQGACLWHRRTRVRIPSLAPITSSRRLAPVAQWIEHWASDPGAVGSTPARRAKFRI